MTSVERVTAESQRLQALVKRDVHLDSMGRCPVEKGNRCANLIAERGCSLVVEIGVYRGSALLAFAAGIKHTKGLLVGIDPWAVEDFLEDEPPSDRIKKSIEAFCETTSLEEIYQTLHATIRAENLQESVTLLRGRSQDVSAQVQALSSDGLIDFLHIDGNHDTVRVTCDLNTYLPLMRPGAIVVMDDTDWPSVRKTLHILTERARIIHHASNYEIWQMH